MDVVTGRELHHAVSLQLSQRLEELVLTEASATTPEPVVDAGPDGPYSPGDALRHAVRPRPQPLSKLLIAIECTAELRQPPMRRDVLRLPSVSLELSSVAASATKPPSVTAMSLAATSIVGPTFAVSLCAVAALSCMPNALGSVCDGSGMLL